MSRTPQTLMVIVFLMTLPACDRGDQPTASDAVISSPRSSPAVSKEPHSHIETTLVEFSHAPQTLTLAGKVMYGENRYSKISSPVQGRVMEVRARLGDHVEVGDVLLVVDSPDISRAYADFIREHSELGFATRSYQLARDLHETKALPLKDLKQAENDFVKAQAEFRRAKERLLSLRVAETEVNKPISEQHITSRFELRSPLSGTVVERAVTPGQSVGGDSGQVLFTVADLERLQVVADVYERDLAVVRQGQAATVTVEAYPDVGFPAVVAAISDIVDPNTRTIKIRSWVTNDDRKLKPEMFARLHLDLGNTQSILNVPTDAVVVLDAKEYVYVMEADGRLTKRAVKIGTPSEEFIPIVEGLTAGDRIARGAAFIKGKKANG